MGALKQHHTGCCHAMQVIVVMSTCKAAWLDGNFITSLFATRVNAYMT